jgi:two-component system nitrate/nitrite response regulator NarL
MLATAPDLHFCGEATDGGDALRAVEQFNPDVVLMDVHMAGMDGAETTKRLLGQYPNVKVVAWTVSDSSDDLLRMIQAGCCGYVLKDVGPEELLRALRAALRSESPVPRSMIPEVLRRIAAQTPLSHGANVALTSREIQALRGIAKGFTNKRLSTEMGVAVPSVEAHLRNAFRKLGVRNRGEAVSAGLRLGVLTLADL